MKITKKDRKELDNQVQRLRMDAYLDGYPDSLGLFIDHPENEVVLMEMTRHGDRQKPAIGRHAWPTAAEAIDGLRALRKKHGTRSS